MTGFCSLRFVIPVDYGYFPNTIASDGDPLDLMILVEEPTLPGCHIFVRLVGVLLMKDEKGIDEKILAVPTIDQRFKVIHDIKQIPQHRLGEIENFFAVYKDLEEGNSEAVSISLDRIGRKTKSIGAAKKRKRHKNIVSLITSFFAFLVSLCG